MDGAAGPGLHRAACSRAEVRSHPRPGRCARIGLRDLLGCPDCAFASSRPIHPAPSQRASAAGWSRLAPGSRTHPRSSACARSAEPAFWQKSQAVRRSLPCASPNACIKLHLTWGSDREARSPRLLGLKSRPETTNNLRFLPRSHSFLAEAVVAAPGPISDDASGEAERPGGVGARHVSWQPERGGRER